MSSINLARVGLAVLIALPGMGGMAASADDPLRDALPVAEITARNAAAVVTLRVSVPEERMMLQGSGFLVDPSGTIVTVLHLIDRAEKVLVRTSDGRRFREVVVRAYDSGSDLAVLQIDGEGLPTVAIGATSELKPGDPISVISNPLGLARTVAEGVLGAWRDPLPLPDQLDEEQLEEDREFGSRRRIRAAPNRRILQVSVPLTVGSSGAPVFDRLGQVVGVVTAVQSYGELDLNFAIPAELIRPLLEIDQGLTLASLHQQADRDRADLAEPHIQSARLALELDLNDEAEREIDAALQLFPGSAEAQLLESELLRRRQDLAGAERILLEVTRRQPQSAEAWLRLGELQLQKNHGTGLAPGSAREALERAYALDDTLAAAAHSLGLVAFREGRYRSATRLLQDAQRLDPARSETGLWLGEVHLRMARAREAEAVFERSLDIDPGDPRCHHGLARAYGLTGQHESARYHFGRFLEMTEGAREHEALRERTILYLARHRHLVPLEQMDLIAGRPDAFTP